MKNNKVILVTGASSGLGKDFARQLIKEGHTVYAAARREEKMNDLKQEGCIPIKMDITEEQSVQNVVNIIQEKHGALDVLINNAGFGMYGAMEDTTIEDARYQFEVNIFGLARITQLLLPAMREKRSGTIINISSVGGKIYTPLGAWYHATKHALEGWSDSLRVELKEFKINVVIIEPGAIKTEFGDVMVKPMKERTGSGPYAGMVNKLAALSERSLEKGNGSPPQVITRLILKAINSKKPKTRYAAGLYAKPLLFIRKWFSDQMFDRVILAMMK